MRRTPLLLLLIIFVAPFGAATGLDLDLTGVVHTEGVAEQVLVRVWDMGPSLIQHPEGLEKPLFEGAAVPGRSFGVALKKVELPVMVQASAEGHVAVGFTIVVPEQAELPPAWLPEGRRFQLKVVEGGSMVAGAWIGGKISDRGSAGNQWRGVIPRAQTDDAGSLWFQVPESGYCSAVALTAEGAWGRWSASLATAGSGNRLEIDSRPVPVVVRDPRGNPVVDALVVAAGAPDGAVQRTGEQGTASVQVSSEDEWKLVALAGGLTAILTGHGRPDGPLRLDLEPQRRLEVRWQPPISPLVVTHREQVGTLQPPVIGRGGLLSLPCPSGTVEVEAWGPQVRPATATAGATDKRLILNVVATASLDGEVVKGEEGVPAVPVWLHEVPPWMLRTKRDMNRLRQSLKPGWLPSTVSDDSGRFEIGGLGGPVVRAEARPSELPPVESELLETGPGSHNHVVLRLVQGTWLRIRVTDPDGEPLEAATADVFRAEPESGGSMRFVFGFGGDREQPLATASTDEEGAAEVKPLRPGPVTVRLSRPGSVTRRLDAVEVPAEGLDMGDEVLQPGVAITGHTVDDDGRPVGHAEVSLNTTGQPMFFSKVASSDDSGRFEIPDQPAEGEVYLQARAEGFVPLEPLRVRMPPDGDVEVRMTAGRRIRGEVLDKAASAPVEGARVTLTEATTMMSAGVSVRMGMNWGTFTTDAAGAFATEPVGAGSFTLGVRAEGYRATEVAVTVPVEGEPDPVTIRLETGLSLSGRVVTAAGEPAAGITVRAAPATRRETSSMFGGAQQATTSEAGTFRIDGLEDGAHELSAEAADGTFAREVASAGSTDEVVLRLSHGGTIRGVVLDPDGAAVDGAEVQASSSSATSSRAAATTDPGGAFELEHLPAGGYTVHARAQGWAPGSAEVTLEDGGVARAEIHLERGGTVIGRVLGLTSAERANCLVRTGAIHDSVAESDGSFRLTGVPEGRQEVIAMVMPMARTRSQWTEVVAEGPPSEVDIDFGAGFELTGTVTRGGQPLSGLMVTVSGRSLDFAASTVTGPDGDWEAQGLEAGEYNVQARRASGLTTLASENVLIESDSRLDLQVPAGSIAGTVRAADTGEPIAGATVVIEAVTAAPVDRHLATDETGSFFFDDLGDGTYSVRASAAGFSPGESTVDLVPGEPQELTLSLGGEQRLVLVVREHDGGIPATVMVHIGAPAGGASTTHVLRCDSAGRCALEEVAAGEYVFLVSGRGAALLAAQVPGPEQQVQLRPQGTLVIGASASAGEGVWRARLMEARTGLVVPTSSWQQAEGEWLPLTGGQVRLELPSGTEFAVQGFGPDGTLHDQQVIVPAGGSVELWFPKAPSAQEE